MNKSNPNYKHGWYGSKTYQSWANMIQRCSNENNPKFKDYGGRGITVCEDWLKFENFLADMGERPVGKTLDRKNVNGNYEKDNCRWATESVQQTNKRNVPLYEFNGQKLSVRQWALATGVDYRTLHKRLQYLGWSLERALTTK